MRFLCLAALLLGPAPFSPSPAQKAEPAGAPKNIEILLNTDGKLTLNGVPGASRASTNKAQNPVNDNLVKEYSEAKETKVFTTRTDAKNSKKHENLAVDIPDGSLVTLRTQTGDVTLDNLSASVSGYIQSGNLTLNGLKGRVELESGQGDITMAGGEAYGMLVAKQGNISLTDVSGTVVPRALRGTVSLNLGREYYGKNPKPLEIDMLQADIRLAAVPYGGTVRLARGTLTASDVSQPLVVWADSATVTLRGVTAPVNLASRGPVSIQLGKFQDSKQASPQVKLDVRGSRVTLELLEGFSGTLQIWSTDVNPRSGEAQVTSSLDLGRATAVENRSPDGRTTIRESSYTRAGLSYKTICWVKN